MNVVVHQAICPNGQFVTFAVDPEEAQVLQPVGVVQENVLPAIPTLRHVVRETRSNDACRSHAGNIAVPAPPRQQKLVICPFFSNAHVC